MAKIIEGNRRGGKILVNDGYNYHKNKKRVNRIYWRCWRRECRANLKTDVFDWDEVRDAIAVRDVRDQTISRTIYLWRNKSL